MKKVFLVQTILNVNVRGSSIIFKPICPITVSVVNWQRFDADPDRTFYIDADPDQDQDPAITMQS
jgi:hypothetical protein